MTRCAATVGFLCLFCAPSVRAQDAPGFLVEDYATVRDAVGLSFANDGTLYVGRSTEGKIHRVSAGGGVVLEWGDEAIGDPDAVLVDSLGLFAPAGSVLVAGAEPGSGGSVRAILPDQGIIDVFPPDPAIVNPNEIQFDRNGRLLLADARASFTRLWVSDGGPLTALIDLPGFGSAAVHPGTNDIYANVGGQVSIYDEAGELLDASFAVLPGPGRMRFGPGHFTWGDDLYAFDRAEGELLRVNEAANVEVIGTGFGGAERVPGALGFGPDGALYVSFTDEDRVVRVSGTPEIETLLSTSEDNLYRSDPDGTVEAFEFGKHLRGMFNDAASDRILVLADLSGGEGWIYTVENAASGVPILNPLATTPRFYSDMTRVGDTYYVTRTGWLYRLDLSDPAHPVETAVGNTGLAGTSGVAYDPVADRMYLLVHSTDVLYEIDRVNAALRLIGPLGINATDSDLAWFGDELYAAVQNKTSGRFEIGRIDTVSGAYSTVQEIAGDRRFGATGLAILPGAPVCEGDLNRDGRRDLGDLSILLGNFGQWGMDRDDGDLTGDGYVGLDDLGLFLPYFGDACDA